MIFARYVRGLLYFPSLILQILRYFSIIYFDHSQQEKNVDFLVHNSNHNRSLRFQVKSS